MTIEGKKLELIDWLTSLSDETIISQLYTLKEKSDSSDWYNELTPSQKKAIKRSLKESKAGKNIPHEQVRNQIHEKIQQLKKNNAS